MSLISQTARMPDRTEVHAINDALTAMPHPDVLTAGGLAAMRAASYGPEPELGLTPSLRSIPGPAAVLPARVFRPAGPARAVLLNLHGGGFCLGAAIDDDWFCDLIARLARVAVVSIDYRLAPEHPYPAGVEDCLAAALWLAENAHAEFGTDRLIVGGSSAGGYFAAQALLGLRRHGLIDRVVAANLVFGGYDLSMTPSQRSATDETLVLTQSWLRGFRQLFLPGLAPEDARDPAISPLYADLSGLPPALFTVGTLDPLLDDSLFMAARWRAAGNAAQLDTWPDCVHGFMNMYPVTGRAAWTGVAEWLSGQLTAAGQ